MSVAALAIPRLETERLILRGHREDDFEAALAMWQDPEVRRHFHGKEMTREDAWGRFLRNYGMWALRGYGLFAVEDKSSGDYVGLLGLFDVKREITPPVEDLPEAGWTLAARFHGRGYATEAMQAVLRWADAQHRFPAAFCILAPANQASLRVAEKCGFRRWYETMYESDPTLVLRRENPDGK